MNTKGFLLEFTVIFMITFAVVSIVSYCWNFFINSLGTCSWDVAFQFAILFAFLCPVIDMMKSEGKGKD